MEHKTIVLATYRDHTQDARHAVCMEALRTMGIMVLDVTGSPHIDIARSGLATAALELGADVAFFIDADIVFEPLDVERLANVVRETRGVVGAPYSLREMGRGVVAGIVPKDDHVTFFEGGGLYDAQGVIGMGFTAIHREVLEKIKEIPGYSLVDTQAGTVYPFFQKLVIDKRWLHEDASFCEAARLVGAPTQIDTRIRLTHLGTYGFRIEDSCKAARPNEPTLSVRAKLHH